MSALAAIQIKRRQLFREDDDWRDFLERVTGVRSARDLKPAQSTALLAEMDRLLGGRTTPSKPRRKPLEGPYAKKIQALWIGAWNLGLVRTRDDAALSAFVKRQTGIDHPNWMDSPEDALKVIEALKSMMGRRGVRWSFTKTEPHYIRLPGYQIALAQYRLIETESGKSFGHWVMERSSGKMVAQLEFADWIPLMNSLGTTIRAMVSSGRLSGEAAA